MIAPIAPVLQRIAQIEQRFASSAARPLGGELVGAGAVPADPGDFDAVMTATEDATETRVQHTAASGPAGHPTVWTGVGSAGWVYPNGAPSAAPSTVPVASPLPLGGVPATAPSGPPVAPSPVTTPPIDVIPSGAAPVGAGLPPDTPYAELFDAASARHGVPVRMLAAVAWVESRFQPDVTSAAGAQGLMQLMPFVSEHYGVNPWDPAQAIDTGARILAEHYQRFNSWDLALAAYNAGAGAVAAAGNQPPSPGVAGYVTAVNERMEVA